MKHTFTAPIQTWKVLPEHNGCPYMLTTIPFETASEVLKAELYNGTTGRGNQRKNVPGHVKKMAADMTMEQFTPSTMTAVGDIDELNPDGTFTVTSDKPLPLVNGDHRRSSLQRLLEEAIEAGETETVKHIQALEIPLVIVFGGGTAAEHFLNLQKGKQVESNQLTVMRTRAKAWPKAKSELMDKALKLGTTLQKESGSFLQTHISFDSRPGPALKFSSLAAFGPGDSLSSLVGFVRIADETFRKEEAAAIFSDVFKSLKGLEQLSEGGALAPPPDGNVASATLLIGVVSLAAFRAAENGRVKLNHDEVGRLKASICKVFTDGRRPTSAQEKRVAMADLARDFLEDMECEFDKATGVPVRLVEFTSAAAFPYGNFIPNVPAVEAGEGDNEDGSEVSA